MLITLKEIFKYAGDNVAIGAFNIHNLEFIKGVVQAAEETQRPAIMMINEAVLKYGGIEILGGAAIAAAKKASVDMAVMVDHGEDIDFLKKCIDFGLDIMFDGSHLPFEENIKLTKMMADYAHSHNRSIEGEIGQLGLSEDGDEETEQKITSVEEAVTFASKTDIDVLAISVGNVHGFYKGEAKINVPRIKEISSALEKMPIVMHGGSDIPSEIMRASIQAGIKKFNIATDLKHAYALTMYDLMHQDTMPIQPLQLFPVVADAVAAVAAEKIKIFSSEV
ncbi:class II fructose-bisphosphate aldolase [Candidatus Epulonipiscium viviparus]|uniref:class II fructose-bisphosphate aldolase n=1 Tax=Candidatus Epulonipiscium viviparus TaxID=420336 RepID=UPI002738059D|nr:class II fructose-bisphosphate aldolase [Candidatus Epulopiscium viviparus]